MRIRAARTWPGGGDGPRHVGTAALAPLFFLPNAMLLFVADMPGSAPLVPGGNLLLCALTAAAFALRGLREPQARTAWLLLGLAAAAVGIGPLHELLAALAGIPRPPGGYAGDRASLLALPVGGVALLFLPVRWPAPGKTARFALDSLLFAAASVFIACSLAYSLNMRLEYESPTFRDATLLQIALVILDLAVVLYLVRCDPSYLRGPVALLAGSAVAAVLPVVLASRHLVSEGGYAAAHPVHLFYSASLCLAFLAARCPWPGRPAPADGDGPARLATALTCVTYAPIAVTVLVGVFVISGNRHVFWSGYVCFALLIARLLLASADYRRLSQTLQERVRERTLQLEESQARLARAERLDALGRLAGGVAHDFNNLLTAIVGNAQILEDLFPPGDRRRAFVTEIVRACDRAGSMTRQLLTFARKQPRRLRVISPADLVREMQGLLRRTISESVNLTVGCDPGAGNVKLDPYQLEQIVMNLALNARDAMPRGGSLLIEVANVDVDLEGAAAHPNARPGPYVRLRVRDTGSGIPREVIENIFDPFFTTKGQGRGTGLGLAICYGIVNEAGGYLTVESELDRGTTFEVYLPACDEPLPPPSAVPPPAPPARRKGTILLAEDEPMVRTLLVEVLHSAGYDTLVAENGAEAVRLAGDHRGQIELFLTDLVMPEMGGLAAAERVTALHPETKVLVMSGYTADESVSQHLQSSDTPFVLKPVTPRALLGRIDEVLAD
jgi:signal transduction histidine kinase/CheY-like chemotaxis protein